VLSALCVIAFSMLFGCCAMRFGRIVVMFGSLIVFVLRHWISSDKFQVASVNLLGPDWFRHASGMRMPGLLAIESVQLPRR
jgi:hypothetical protein